MLATTEAIFTHYGNGEYLVGEKYVLVTHRLYCPNATKPPVLYGHGALGTALSVVSPSATRTQFNWPRLWAAEGYPVLCGDFGGPGPWGSAAATTPMELGRQWLIDAWGAADEPAIVLGASMGGVNGWNYMRSYPDSVRCGIFSIPVTNLDDIRNADRGGFRDDVEAAWGVGPLTAPNTPPLPAGANPALHPGEITKPVQVWYSDDDPICVLATQLAMEAALGELADYRSVGAHMHSEAALAGMDFSEQLDFALAA